MFDKYPEGKESTAKKILVYSYMTKTPSEFYFLPNNGKGGVMLKKNPLGGERLGEMGIPMYSEFSMEYLCRITDKGKRRRREVERARREQIKSQGTEQLRQQGYISMNEMRDLSQLSYSTLYDAIRRGKMKGKNMFKTWYVKKEDFQSFLDRYKPRPHPQRQTSSVYHFEDLSDAEQRLLATIKNEDKAD